MPGRYFSFCDLAAVAQQRAHVVHLAVHRAGVAARAVDLFHDHRRRGQAEAGAAVLLGDHRGQPAGFHQRIDELLRVGLLFVDLAEVLVGELAAQVAHGVADVLVLVGFVQHGMSPCRCVSGRVRRAWRSPPSRAGRRVSRPEPDGVAVVADAAADGEGRDVEERLDRAEGEVRDRRVGAFAPQPVEQQRRDQRPVHHEARIALDLRDVAAVVVNAVAVEGQRRVAEQQHVVGADLAYPLRVVRRALHRRGRIVGARVLAIDDVVFVSQRQALLVEQLVKDAHEHQRTGAPFLGRDVGDARTAGDGGADDERPVECELAAGPHAPRQRHRRQEAAALRVSVDADLRLRVQRQEVEPMPAGRNRVACLRLGVVAVERGGQRLDRDGGSEIAARLGLADPLLQMFDVDAHVLSAFGVAHTVMGGDASIIEFDR